MCAGRKSPAAIRNDGRMAGLETWDLNKGHSCPDTGGRRESVETLVRDAV
jgi:hypothetical protein